MRYLILSDIHANLTALETVLSHADGRYDRIVNCGDIVGYGPDPNAVVEWCRKTPQIIVRGNHDRACAGLTDLEWFNATARLSALWTSAVLEPENRDFLLTLPRGPVTTDGFEIFHGAPADEDEYLLDRLTVEASREDLSRGLAFFGHTHVQGGFLLHRTGIKALATEVITVDDSAHYLINAGSVGQPRDQDPRAAYALFDDSTRTVEFCRSAYEIGRTYRRLTDAGLPEALGRRLFQGT